MSTRPTGKPPRRLLNTQLDGTPFGAEEVEELTDLSPGGLEVPRLGLSDQVFELGEDLFDGVQIGALGWQEEEMSALGSDDGAGRLALVAAEVSPAGARAVAPRGISARGYWLHNSAN